MRFTVKMRREHRFAVFLADIISVNVGVVVVNREIHKPVFGVLIGAQFVVIAVYHERCAFGHALQNFGFCFQNPVARA